METMSPQDASFLHTGGAVTHMHIGSVGIFDGPARRPMRYPRRSRDSCHSFPATGRRCASSRWT
jgi:hypothetical protein